MRNSFKRALALLIAIACALAGSFAAFARSPAQAQEAVLAYLTVNATAPAVSFTGGEWAIFALARSGATVPSGYYDGYLSRVRQTLQSTDGVLSPATEYARVAIALSALGEDAASFHGHNLLLPLADFNEVTAQGINGAIFALIAFDTRNWAVPEIADEQAQASRQRLIDFILSREIAGGGFAMNPMAGTATADVTAMALQALAPYRTQPAVAAAIDRALALLPGLPLANAGDAAQAIVALATLGVSPAGLPLDSLLALQQPNGSFFHVAAGTGNRQMATEQAAYALVAYDRFLGNQTALHDMSDVAPRAQLDIARTAKISAIQAVTYGLNQADYTVESWNALLGAMNHAIARVNSLFNIEAINAVEIPPANGLIERPAQPQPPMWWESPPLPAWLHFLLRYLFFGWIWMS